MKVVGSHGCFYDFSTLCYLNCAFCAGPVPSHGLSHLQTGETGSAEAGIGTFLGNLFYKSLYDPELRLFWVGFPYFSLPFGVTSAVLVAINCLDLCFSCLGVRHGWKSKSLDGYEEIYLIFRRFLHLKFL